MHIKVMFDMIQRPRLCKISLLGRIMTILIVSVVANEAQSTSSNITTPTKYLTLSQQHHVNHAQSCCLFKWNHLHLQSSEP